MSTIAINEQPPRRLAPLCEKITRSQVQVVITAFYQKLRTHPELAPFFAHIDDFNEHEAHIADFWWLAMGGRLAARPSFDMIRRHRPLNLTDAALAQWLALFDATLQEYLAPELARQWLRMAQGIGVNLKRMLFSGA